MARMAMDTNYDGDTQELTEMICEALHKDEDMRDATDVSYSGDEDEIVVRFNGRKFIVGLTEERF